MNIIQYRTARPMQDTDTGKEDLASSFLRLLRKGLEKATIYDLKEAIVNDPTLSKGDKTFWISFLDGVSIGNDVMDIIKMISSG